MHKMSIIIPCYKARGTIGKTLHSIAMQSIADSVEIIVVNDADNLEYGDIIKNFPELNIHYITRSHNGGCGAARNTGIREALTNFVCFLDSDDMFAHPLALEVMYNSIVTAKSDMLSSAFESEIRKPDGVVLKPIKKNCTWTHGRVYNRQYLLDNNLFFKEELRINEDVEFHQILLDLGAKTCEIPMTTLLWRDNPNSVTHESLYKNKKSYVEAVTVYLRDCAERGMIGEKVVVRTLQNIVVCYQYYNIVADECPENKQDYLDACKKYWKLAEPILKNADDELATKVYCAVMKDFAVMPSVSFTEFLRMI